ncbi:alpha/beta hydrolase [Peteryoungia algae]|uniref:Alpha/beta hydrolase n=1 Tax=Peteryoungia algae TaxID=2919917 RepID=A0ABT0D5I3_9HYPH|nr:alpha/beta hydrolase [Rhizobium sp. SSM4.3]MCJ8240661.1 alpha/beta hydrolase [Rhizobium sp. SSM4.3]
MALWHAVCTLYDGLSGGDVLVLMDALHFGRAHIPGLSIDGLTGSWLALIACERFDKMTFCATAARIGTAQGWADHSATVPTDGVAKITASTQDSWLILRHVNPNPTPVRDMIDNFVSTSVEGDVGCRYPLVRTDYRALLNMISNPQLAIAGRDAPVCKPNELAVIATTVRRGNLCILPVRHLVNMKSAMASSHALALLLLRISF